MFSNSYQLIAAEPRQHTYLACALLMRGSVSAGTHTRTSLLFPEKGLVWEAQWASRSAGAGQQRSRPVVLCAVHALALRAHAGVGGRPYSSACKG